MPHRERLPGLRRVTFAVLGLIVLPAFAAGPAAAYNGGAAAAWADSHALNYNCSQLPCDDNDCTNFVSLAMNLGGGYPQVLGIGVPSDDSLWFNVVGGLGQWNQSWSWAYVQDQYQFQMVHSPGGYKFGTAPGTAGWSFSGLVSGDLLFYDWDSNGSLDHSAIQATRGTDPNWQGGAQYGDLIDEHSNDRARVWWTLYPYNPARNNTVITLVHISPSN